MKTKLLILVVLLSTQFIIAQNYQTIEEIDDACTQLGFSGDDDAEIAVDAILDKIGLFRNFIIQECPEINNAVAKNIDVGNGHKERYILYDASFFKKIDDKAENGWAATSVLAHEIGHHLNGHSLNNEGSNHKFELEADEFSGFVLAKMGASLKDTQSAINTLKYEKATRTHPAKVDRLLRIEKGWNRGKGKVIAIKKIEEEIINEIIENDEDEITDIDGVTGQQVLANYIDAIGGQERVKGIRTLKSNVTSTLKYFIGEKETEYSNKINYTYLTPNKYRTEINVNGTESYMLNLDGKSYTKTKKKKNWKFQSYLKTEDNASFVPEYSMLVNNDEVKLIGIVEVEGELCYKVQLPSDDATSSSPTLNMVISCYASNFYSVRTGLLVLSESICNSGTDFIKKPLQDSKTTSKQRRVLSDYRSVDGVLFPFKIEMRIESDTYNSNSTAEYSKISINEEIDKKEFEVKD
ncbi:MAG: hypothetical protein ACI87N_001906 [Flavobacteriales bacterium]|jgi:hypothetical protein